MRARLWAVCAVSAALVGCGDQGCIRHSDCLSPAMCVVGKCVVPEDGSVDASLDASLDAAVDASLDAAVDASLDAAVDASLDAATSDAAAMSDAGDIDGGMSMDAGDIDAGDVDAAIDAGP